MVLLLGLLSLTAVCIEFARGKVKFVDALFLWWIPRIICEAYLTIAGNRSLSTLMQDVSYEIVTLGAGENLPHRARHPTVHHHDLPGDGGCRDEHHDLRRDVFRLAHTAEYCLAPCTGRDSIG